MLDIVDSHFHLWDLSLNKHQWLTSKMDIDHHGDLTKIKKNYLLSDYLTESKIFNIKKSVHVQANWNENDSIGETAWLQSLADKYIHPHAIIGFVDFTKEDCHKMIEDHMQYANIRGFRQIASYSNDMFYNGCSKDLVTNSKWLNNLSILKEYNLSFDLMIYPEQVDSIIKLIKTNNTINFIVNHYMKPTLRTKEYFDFFKAQIKKISCFDNVYLKLSGFGMHEHKWTINTMSNYVHFLIENFGVDRCLFGSNFPVDKLYSTMDDLCLNFNKIIDKYTKSERLKILMSNAEEVYRI